VMGAFTAGRGTFALAGCAVIAIVALNALLVIQTLRGNG
jgi:hypothetical protein